MALSIMNNVASLGAQKALTKASNMQSKTLERLSSGLRINHASDDASGLAISEKLRGQISGLKRASMNAQDGISYLQSAEGGMEAVTSMLQRMREIAVQAGNGIYTTNDRSVLQLEVDQLKDEINRISRSTEFNTKKLLDGSGTALWSSTSDQIGAIIRGPEAAEGNYKIENSLNPGSNSQYKSNIMSVKNGVLVSEVTNFDTTTSNLVSVRDPKNLGVTGTKPLNVTVSSGSAGRTTTDVSNEILTNMKTFQQTGSNWRVSSAHVTAAMDTSGYFEVEMLDTGKSSSTFTFRYRMLDSATGKLSNWITGTATNAATATITLSGTAAGVGAGNIVLSVPFGSDIRSGDKILSSFSHIRADVAGGYATSGGGTIKVSDGPTIDYSKVGSLTKADNNNFKDDFNEVTIHMGALDPKTGVVNYGSLTLEFKEGTPGAVTPGAGVTLTGSTTINIRDNGAATKDTKLTDLKQFVDADGVNILTNTQELKIYAGGKSAVIYFEADDTIEDFEEKLTKALVDQLGLGADDTTSAGISVNNNLVNYVPNLHETDGTSESVPGTFIIQTAKLGSDSDLIFIGDQGLVNALGIAQIRQGENSTMDVKVTEAHTGKFIGSDNLGDGRLRSVINGVEVVLKYDSGVQSSWDSAAKTIKFEADTNKATNYLHIVDNRTELQIGANQGQTMNISVGQLDTTGLEIDDVYVMDMALAQKAITKLDKALERVNASRSTIGAQANRLEYAMNNLETTRSNLTAAESRIRDLDMAEETSKMSQYQVLVQAATAMVAQANQVPQYALTLLKG